MGKASFGAGVFSDLGFVAVKVSSDVLEGNDCLVEEGHLLWTCENQVLSYFNGELF